VEGRVLVGPAGGEVGLGGWDAAFFGREVVGLAYTEEGVVGITGFVVSENDEGLVQYFELFGVAFGNEASRELCVGFADSLCSGTGVNLKDLVVVQ
jgi:hypothetical protein